MADGGSKGNAYGKKRKAPPRACREDSVTNCFVCQNSFGEMDSAAYGLKFTADW